jgi:hypothetical protein
MFYVPQRLVRRYPLNVFPHPPSGEQHHANRPADESSKKKPDQSTTSFTTFRNIKGILNIRCVCAESSRLSPTGGVVPLSIVFVS